MTLVSLPGEDLVVNTDHVIDLAKVEAEKVDGERVRRDRFTVGCRLRDGREWMWGPMSESEATAKFERLATALLGAGGAR